MYLYLWLAWSSIKEEDGNNPSSRAKLLIVDDSPKLANWLWQPCKWYSLLDVSMLIFQINFVHWKRTFDPIIGVTAIPEPSTIHATAPLTRKLLSTLNRAGQEASPKRWRDWTGSLLLMAVGGTVSPGLSPQYSIHYQKWTFLKMIWANILPNAQMFFFVAVWSFGKERFLVLTIFSNTHPM